MSKDIGIKKITYKEMSGQASYNIVAIQQETCIYTLSNGTQLLVSPWERTSFNNTDFAVDINGFAPPNQLGKDVFMFQIFPNPDREKVTLAGTYSTSQFKFENEPNKDRDVLLGKKDPIEGAQHRFHCSKSGNGAWCGRLIMVDGWEIRDDYPWN